LRQAVPEPSSASWISGEATLVRPSGASAPERLRRAGSARGPPPWQ
jgi:hypothetical protein